MIAAIAVSLRAYGVGPEYLRPVKVPSCLKEKTLSVERQCSSSTTTSASD